MSSDTIVVSTAAQLASVLSVAKAPLTVLLAPGSYGDVSLKNLNPSAPITIASLDPTNQALMSSLKLTNDHNLTFRSIEVAHIMGPNDVLSIPAVTINKSSDIVLMNMFVHGSLDGNDFNDGHGVTATDSQRLAVVDSRFTELNSTLNFSRCVSVVEAGNDISNARQGTMVADVQGGLFDRNYIHDMHANYAAGDHADSFQVGTGATANASNDLTFTNNVIIDCVGETISGIFVRSERYGEGIVHGNITVENNYFAGNYRHGLSFNGVAGLTVSGNTVVNTDGSQPSTAIYLKAVDNAVIDHNAAAMFLLDKTALPTNVAMAANVDLYDAQSKVGAALSGVLTLPTGILDDFHALDILLGSATANLGAGFQAVEGIGHALSGASGDIGGYADVLANLQATLPVVPIAVIA